MTQAKMWTVEIAIEEHDDERLTQAVAMLRPHDRPDLRGRGVARRNPVDREVPEIGDEIAVARALADLAYQLLDVAADDIEQITHRPARLRA